MKNNEVPEGESDNPKGDPDDETSGEDTLETDGGGTAIPNVPHSMGHRFQPGPIVDERSRRSALRFLPRHKFFHQFLDRQIPVFDNFLFLKALPRFQG
jgi:hypothetical protein